MVGALIAKLYVLSIALGAPSLRGAETSFGPGLGRRVGTRVFLAFYQEAGRWGSTHLEARGIGGLLSV